MFVDKNSWVAEKTIDKLIKIECESEWEEKKGKELFNKNPTFIRY